MSLEDYVSEDLLPYVENAGKGIKKYEFDLHYKEELFLLWYRSGKPNVNKFYASMPNAPDGNRPAQSTIGLWARTDWKLRAEDLDAQVSGEIEKRLIYEKIEMLTRHAKIGKEMQEMSKQWLTENYGEMTAASAVRLLDLGLRVERESKGIPAALESMIEKTDEELLEELKAEMKKSNVEFEMLEE